MYHRFGYSNSTLFVTPENFAKQMDYLKKHNYRVISLDELIKGIEHNKYFPHNTVVITIDDGYRDSYIYAFSILKKYNFPATIFIITNYIGKKKEFLNWGEVKEMSNNGITFGAHTRNHVYLPGIKDRKVLWNEIKGSKLDLERKLKVPINYFCYPIGGFNKLIKEMVRNAGYKGACATNRGSDRFNRDVYALKRIKVTNSDVNKPLSFWAKLSGYYNLFRKKRKGD